MKKINEALFRMVVFCFSALLLIMTLLTSIELAAVNDRAAKLQEQIESVKNDNEILRAAFENSLSLAEIESYAIQSLGMQRCSPGQILYIEMP